MQGTASQRPGGRRQRHRPRHRRPATCELAGAAGRSSTATSAATSRPAARRSTSRGRVAGDADVGGAVVVRQRRDRRRRPRRRRQRHDRPGHRHRRRPQGRRRQPDGFRPYRRRRSSSAAALVTFNGATDGSVDVRGGQVIVNAPARIGGDLVVCSLRRAGDRRRCGDHRRRSPGSSRRTWWSGDPRWAWVVGFAVVHRRGTVLAGIVLMLFGGGVFADATEPCPPPAAVELPVRHPGADPDPVRRGRPDGDARRHLRRPRVLLILPFLVVFGHAVAAAGIAGGILVRRTGELGVGRSAS